MESPIGSEVGGYGASALAYPSALPQSMVGKAEPDWIAGFEESKKTNGQSPRRKKRPDLPIPQQMAKPRRREAPSRTQSLPRRSGKN